jgi:hypothetical protein
MKSSELELFMRRGSMYILKIEQSKLNQLSFAVECSADFVDDDRRHLEFVEAFGGGGICGNMAYDSYNQFNIFGDKIIELGFGSKEPLMSWIGEIEGLINEAGINAADSVCRWKTDKIIEEIKIAF